MKDSEPILGSLPFIYLYCNSLCLIFCFNSQSVISQSLTCQQHADCDLPHVSRGYRFLSARHCRSFSCLQFISPPIEVGESLLYLVKLSVSREQL